MHNCPPPTQSSPSLVSRSITGSPSWKYEHRRTSALLRNYIYFECYATMPMFAVAHISSLSYLWIQIKRLAFTLMLARRDLTLPGLLIFLGGRYSCLVPRSHFFHVGYAFWITWSEQYHLRYITDINWPSRPGIVTGQGWEYSKFMFDRRCEWGHKYPLPLKTPKIP